jgi:hypothetical protein
MMIDGAIRLLSLANQLAFTTRRVRLDFEEGEGGTMGYLNRMGFFDHLAPAVEVLPSRPVYSGARLHRGSNPQISKEQWPMSSIMAIVASGITFNLAKQFQKPRWARSLALVGLVIAIVSVLMLTALVDNLFLTAAPEMQDFCARSLFVFLFTALGLSIGYGLSNIL